MTSSSAFAGVHLVSGRKPLTLALLDDDLNLIQLASGELSKLGAFLADLKSATICITTRSKPNSIKFVEAYSIFQQQLAKMSFLPLPAKNEARQWFKTDADESFGALLQHKLFSHRTLEGRIQRGLVLYEQGLRINDPMEFFEEITRYKLMQGVLPLDNLYSAKELDALVAAYVAWLAANRSRQIVVRGEFVLPAQE